jgi:chemotaxis protein MotA
MASSSLADSIGIFKTLGMAYSSHDYHAHDVVVKMMAFSEKARREGLLALEEELEDLDNEFMKKGLRLVVDGTDASIISDLMGSELDNMQSRHANKVTGVAMWSALGPAFGMLGTVIGLIAMLKNLDDPSSIGPNMAIALITTLYGSMMSNWLFTPIMGKLKDQDAAEAQVDEMIIEGVLSIQAGDNPRTLAQKMLAYFAPVDRKSLEAEILKD